MSYDYQQQSPLEALLAEKRRSLLTPPKEEAKEEVEIKPTKVEISNENAVLLACAAGVLPSVIATVYDLDRKLVKRTIEEHKDKVQEYCRMITTDYQAVRVNMLFDTVISKLQEIIDSDDTNATALISAAKEVKAMIRDGDVGKAFNREVMDDTYESAPENVDFMLKKIKEIEDKERGLLR